MSFVERVVAWIEPQLAMPFVLPSALAAVALLLLGSLLLGRRRTRTSRRRADPLTKVAGRSRRPRATRPARRDRPERAFLPNPAHAEEVPEMTSHRTRGYLQILQVLLREPGQKHRGVGLEPARKLAELARAIDEHRTGAVQNLGDFADESSRLLHFEVRTRAVPNSDGVALRFTHEGVVFSEAPGPYRPDVAARLAGATSELQHDLRAWLDAVLALTAASTPGERAASVRPHPAPFAPRAPTPAPGQDAGFLDLSDLGFRRDPVARRRREQKVEDENATRAGFESPIDVDEDAPNVLGAMSSAGGPAPLASIRDRSLAASTFEDPERTNERRTAPPVAGLPTKLARSIEELELVRAELATPPPDGLLARAKLLTADSLDRTSLLDRVDRLVFSAPDMGVLPTGATGAASTKDALRWLRTEQDTLARTLRDRFGLEPFHAELGQTFEPTLHIATDTEATSEPHRDRTVARTQSHGYQLRVGNQHKLLRRPKVHIFVYEPGADDGRPDDASARSRTGSEPARGSLDVPLDSTYPGQSAFSITVYTGWNVQPGARAWIEVDGRELEFASVQIRAGTPPSVHLEGCEIPADVRQGDGFLVVEDTAGGYLARHPFEVIT